MIFGLGPTGYSLHIPNPIEITILEMCSHCKEMLDQYIIELMSDEKAGHLAGICES